MWVMLRTKLPTEVSPPKMSLFWSVPWPAPWDGLLNRIERTILPSQVAKQSKKEVMPLSEEELKQEYFLDGCSKVPNWVRARKIHYKEVDVRIFPHEFSEVANEKMQYYLNEGAYDLIPNSVAETILIYGSDGKVVEGKPSFVSDYPQSDQRMIYEAALIDGCTHAQALIVAFGGDPSDEVSSIPAIGWYKLKKEYASVFCYEWEMKE